MTSPKKLKPDLTKLLTIYGRKPTIEALQNNNLPIFRLHLASTNKNSPIINEIIHTAKQRNIETLYHSKKELSRISKNGKQDQGVCLDILMPSFLSIDEFLETNHNKEKPQRLIALDGITNPQNLGMIIRSVCASTFDGILLPDKGCAKLDALVIKASAGTLFKCTIIREKSLANSLRQLSKNKFEICVMNSEAKQSLFDYKNDKACVFVFGNESDGLSNEVEAISTHSLSIPMKNNVESLNVAVSAALVAFYSSA